ncbi:MAG: Smr/MutS family protein [Gammaproteobacteria bacterium]
MNPISDDDSRAFREAMEGVRPLETDTREPARRPKSPVARFRRQDDRAVLDESLASDPEHASGTGQDLAYRSARVSQAVFRKLRRGGFALRQEIDLHGLTSHEAREALDGFLKEAVDSGWQCVRIIHGKGHRSGHRGPVLKRKVGKWLQNRDSVLAYCSARPVDGGTGALYVLLDAR